MFEYIYETNKVCQKLATGFQNALVTVSWFVPKTAAWRARSAKKISKVAIIVRHGTVRFLENDVGKCNANFEMVTVFVLVKPRQLPGGN